MFVQIIQGRVGDADAAKETMDRWQRDLEPGAQGWLGGTYGITDDDELIAVVRFESEEAARSNSDRPEQSVWWDQMNRHFTGEITFHDCNDVSMLVGGGSDDATFVQIIQGRVRDRDRVHALMEQSSSMISKYRPDVLGATIAIDADGYVTETVFFTSEDQARLAEKQELPAEVKQVMDEEMSLLEDVRFHDIHHPWFATHAG
ncbi:MAG: hypothetical protein JWM02_3402 [Frankiales bacterium]|nr:hypothetical protein [Frankiales bacterium]